jgi:CRP/FNR family cyclic AMP-dependent transcriptional regulator
MSADNSVHTLNKSELEEISRHGVPREFRARTVLLSEGDRSDAIYIILEGRVRVFVSDGEGREALLSIMGPGEYFGELALDEGPRSASVMTLEACRMLVIPASDLADFVKRNPAFAMHFIRRLISKIRELTESVRSLALMDAYGRVARLLLEQSVSEGGVRFIPERMTQAEIASRVGCSREMVSRIFKDLVQGGYVTLETDRIVVNRKPPARW